MSTTKISAAELASKTRDFATEERVVLDSLSEADVENAALADPDAQPATPEMLRRGLRDRRRRWLNEELRKLGCVVFEADPDLDLPVWEVTDRHGGKVMIQAADIKPVSVDVVPAKIVRLELAAQQEASLPVPERGGK